MPSPLLSLPAELCVRIFEYALCSQGAAVLLQPCDRERNASTRYYGFNDHHIQTSRELWHWYPPRERETYNAEFAASENWESDSESESTADEEDAWIFALNREKWQVKSKPADVTYEIDDEDDGYYTFFNQSRYSDNKYELETVRPMNLALLRVNRQIHDEARTIFYAGITFVIDTDGYSAIHFFKTLPYASRREITSIALTPDALTSGDYGRFDEEYDTPEPWTRATLPRVWGPAAMFTPFGAFLATQMPKLKELSLYVPYGGKGKYNSSFAPIELQQLLVHGRIEKLSCVFFGTKTARVLAQGRSSLECFEAMMGTLLESKDASRQFKRAYPKPSKYDEEAYLDWREARHWYARLASLGGLRWSWGDRDIDMGTCGMVRAVIELRRA